MAKFKDLSEKDLPINFKQTRKAFLFQYFFLVIVLLLPALRIFYKINMLLLLIPSAAALLLLILLELKIFSFRIEIQKNNISLKEGILSQKAHSVYYDDITDIKISQSLIQRFLNYGTIYINTPGGGEYEIYFKRITHPHDIRIFLEKLEDQFAKSRGIQKKI